MLARRAFFASICLPALFCALPMSRNASAFSLSLVIVSASFKAASQFPMLASSVASSRMICPASSLCIFRGAIFPKPPALLPGRCPGSGSFAFVLAAIWRNSWIVFKASSRLPDWICANAIFAQIVAFRSGLESIAYVLRGVFANRWHGFVRS